MSVPFPRAGRAGRGGGARAASPRLAAPALAAALALALGGGPRALAAAQEAPAPAPTPTPPPSAAPESAFGEAVPKPSLAISPVPEGPRRTLAEVVVRGGKTVSGETVAFYLGVKAGEPYDPEKVRRAFPRLWDSGLFEDVSLEEEATPEGVRLVAVVVERPRVGDLEFRGNKKLTTSQLKDKLKEAKAEIRVGGPVSLREISKAKTALTESYRAEGFRSAVVDTTVETMAENQRRVVFLVDEGDKVKIEEIDFTGNRVFSDQRLRNAMKKTRQAHWYWFWDSKDVYNQASYEEDVESIKRLYQDAGYKDVVVKDPLVTTFVVNPGEKRPEKVKRRARIRVPVVEGEQFFFGELKLEGATVFAPERLLRSFLVRTGKPLNRSLLVEGMKAVEALYREKGYIYLFMNPEYAERKDRVVDVTIRVTEGDQYRLGRVEFSGNKTTRDKVLRRELQLAEGDILDMESFRKGVFKITQLGYFKIEEDPEFRVDPEAKTVDVTVKGQDTNRNEIQFGAGYSQLDGLFAQFQFATRNFLGRGDTIGIQFQRGNRSNFFDVSIMEPWFLDQRMSIGASVFNRSLDYLDVNQRTRGVNASVGWGLGLFDVASVYYAYTDTKSRYEVFPPPPPPGGGVPPAAFADFTGRTSAVTPGYRYDSRNDPFDPSRGVRLGASVTVAGGLLGGDFSFVKSLANATWYLPTGRKTFLALNFQGGIVRPYSGGEIPIFERYRIGGDRSVRGFQYGAIFPVDDQDRAYFNEQGALLGGDKFYVVNLEYVYALAGPIKLAAFFDAGNTWIEDQPFRPFDLRTSAGLELRVFLPIFQAPLRFIYGVNLAPKVLKDQDGFTLPNGAEKRTDFQFSIGTTF
ncbi:MAG: outer membrane protein assembly factor BamA [Acidobacteria bacterium]|nr:MAG: outer membrane protein assembly factor BamA [Acidobacteriota bacterium]